VQVKLTSVSKEADLSCVPEEYHKFADIFSKFWAKTLVPHCPYDLQIILEENSQSLVGTIYSLSMSEQEAFKEIINKNLTNSFIRLTSSSHRVPVFFVKKKDRFLWLCIDFCRLNCITKKDRYSLLLTTKLLDSSHKARIYTKINLCYMYYLVWIAKGNEWKTVFWMYYGSFEWSVIFFIFYFFCSKIYNAVLDRSPQQTIYNK